jgi:hypothetical protein
LNNSYYYIASVSKVVGLGGTDLFLYRRSINGWYEDAMIYGNNQDGDFVSIVSHPNGWFYAIGDYKFQNADGAFVAYKQLSEPLTNDPQGDQIPLECFTVDLEEHVFAKNIIRSIYFDWQGKIISMPDPSSCYLRLDTFTDGTNRIIKFCYTED